MTVLAAKSATSTIPIVLAIGSDPVRHGIVASMNRPGGNATGVSFQVVELRPKMVELAREVLPQAKRIALLVNPYRPRFEEDVTGVLQPAKVYGLDVIVLKASNAEEIDVAFSELRGSRVDAVLFLSDPVYRLRRRDGQGRRPRHGFSTLPIVVGFAHAAFAYNFSRRFAMQNSGLMRFDCAIAFATSPFEASRV